MRLLYLLVFLIVIEANASSLKHLSMKKALNILENQNLEIKISKYNEMMKYFEHVAAKAKNYGTLDLEFTALRSNDPGNVFGFKMQSRSASFADFGFSDFLGGIGSAVQGSVVDGMPNFAQFTQLLNQSAPTILAMQPKDLNYPKARNHFITKLTYKVPLYTGGMLSNYKAITQKMYKMSKLDTKKVLAMKKYELKKTFYDIALVNNYILNLNRIKKNINKLKKIIKEMQNEGYAIETDYLEVDARLGEVEAMLDEANLNKKLAYQFLSFLLNNKVTSIIPPREIPFIPRVTKSIVENRAIDIAKARLGLSITKNAIEVAKAKFKPTVGAFVEYGNANEKIFKYTKKGFYTVGLQAKLNLFNGGADKAALEKAKIEYLKTATQVKLAKSGLWLKANKLKSEIRSLNARVRSYTKEYRFAKKVFATYEEKYRLGIVPITDVLIKQSKEIEVLLKLLKIKNDRNAKILALQKLINK